MQFSAVLRSSSPSGGGGGGGGCVWSPNGRQFACLDALRIVVRDGSSLAVAAVLGSTDVVEQLQFSPDSQLLLALQKKRSLVEVFDVAQQRLCIRIDEGLCGISSARFSTSGNEVLTSAEFELRLTIWPLEEQRSPHYIDRPKFGCEQALTFSEDGKYMAVVHRHQHKDLLAVYLCEQWQLATRFEVATTDLVGLSFSPDSSCVCVWDSPLHYRLLVYSLDGRELCRHEPYEDALGIKSVSWNSSGSMLAVGSYDEKLRIFNHINWKSLADLPHKKLLIDRSLVVYKEERALASKGEVQSFLGNKQPHLLSQYVLADTPFEVQQVLAAPDKANPKLGVASVRWSANDAFIATKNDNHPHTVYVWESSRLSLLCVLEHVERVRSFHWCPTQPLLAIVCADSSLFTWTPAGAAVVPIPHPSFCARGIRWSSNGKELLLIDKDSICCCFVSTEDSSASTERERAEFE